MLEIKSTEIVYLKAKPWIKDSIGVFELDFDNEKILFSNLLNDVTSLKLSGIDLVLVKIFDEVGFNQIQNELFKDLVLYRLFYPKSKLKTTEYLYRFSQKYCSEDDVYRYLDKLHLKQKELVQHGRRFQSFLRSVSFVAASPKAG